MASIAAVNCRLCPSVPTDVIDEVSSYLLPEEVTALAQSNHSLQRDVVYLNIQREVANFDKLKDSILKIFGGEGNTPIEIRSIFQLDEKGTSDIKTLATLRAKLEELQSALIRNFPFEQLSPQQLVDLYHSEKPRFFNIFNTFIEEQLIKHFVNGNCPENRTAALLAVKVNGEYLQFGSDEIKRDKEIVLEAITNVDVFALMDPALRGDLDIVLKQAKNYGSIYLSCARGASSQEKRELALSFLDKDNNYAHLSDFEFYLKLMDECPDIYLLAEDNLLFNHHFMLEVLKKNEHAIIKGELVDNPDFIFELAKVNGVLALRIASDEVKNNERVVFRAIEQNRQAVRLAGDEFLNNRKNQIRLYGCLNYYLRGAHVRPPRFNLLKVMVPTLILTSMAVMLDIYNWR